MDREEANVFSWKGTWRNQYGSVVIIEDDSEGLIRGVFKTALPDSSFSGWKCLFTGPLMEM
ncbi:avidin/streptavidin family protein [Mesorhizobium sp. CO1-1-9]|nr:avidin/streptavidin family protein [Mesorhizobium sp. B2-5-7]MBZ9694366.1 avidin/streptavidin family protein [Mesorhizobium sp. CO1-1-9]